MCACVPALVLDMYEWSVCRGCPVCVCGEQMYDLAWQESHALNALIDSYLQGSCVPPITLSTNPLDNHTHTPTHAYSSGKYMKASAYTADPTICMSILLKHTQTLCIKNACVSLSFCTLGLKPIIFAHVRV